MLTRSPGPEGSCCCMNIFLPDHLHQSLATISLHTAVPQLGQLLVVGSGVVTQAAGQAHGQLQEGDLDPLHLRVTVEQLEALGGDEAVAEG